MESVSIYNDEPRAGTFLISQGFNREHKKVIELVKKYKERFLRLEDNKSLSADLIIHKVPAKKAGRPVEEILLNEAQTIFLGSLFRNNEIVLDFKERLAKDFVNLRKKLQALSQQKSEPLYQMTRHAGKIVRAHATKTMQEFIEYAKTQGGSPKGCDMYYTNITGMVNGLLFIVEGKFKNLREVMTNQQLMTISSAEQIIDKGLRDGMKKRMFYKDIYQDVRRRVMTFAELHGQSEVIEKQLSIIGEGIMGHAKR